MRNDCRHTVDISTGEELLPSIATLRAPATANEAELLVDDPHLFVVGDIIHVPRTEENLRVENLTIEREWEVVCAHGQKVKRSEGSITCRRGLGDTLSVALRDKEQLWILGGGESIQ